MDMRWDAFYVSMLSEKYKGKLFLPDPFPLFSMDFNPIGKGEAEGSGVVILFTFRRSPKIFPLHKGGIDFTEEEILLLYHQSIL
jgi:hypothetical protein